MPRTILRGGTVFDGTGADPAVADVAFDGDRIDEIGTDLDGDDEVDCSGKLVIPGLFDCHVHFMMDGDIGAASTVSTPFSLNWYLAAERMARTLACGITTVREAGGADLGVRVAQERGLIPGPRMHLSISILSQTGGHGDDWHVCGASLPGLMTPHPGRPHNIVDGPDEMRRKVREVIRAGADVIKICTTGGVLSPLSDPRHAHFRDDELDVCVAEAAAAGRFVMAHAQANTGIKAAIRAGIRSIEHGIYLDDEAIQMMLDAGTYLVPTLIAPLGVLEAADRGLNVPANMIEKTKLVMEHHHDSISAAVAAGVKVAMGTDCGVLPHGENLRELALMEGVGMSPAEVLVASTRNAAELMGLDGELGTLEPGKRADAVVLDGTGLDVSDVRSRIAKVFQDGALVHAA